jgi:hypothetical protein
VYESAEITVRYTDCEELQVTVPTPPSNTGPTNSGPFTYILKQEYGAFSLEFGDNFKLTDSNSPCTLDRYEIEGECGTACITL